MYYILSILFYIFIFSLLDKSPNLFFVRTYQLFFDSFTAFFRIDSSFLDSAKFYKERLGF